MKLDFKFKDMCEDLASIETGYVWLVQCNMRTTLLAARSRTGADTAPGMPQSVGRRRWRCRCCATRVRMGKVGAINDKYGDCMLLC